VGKYRKGVEWDAGRAGAGRGGGGWGLGLGLVVVGSEEEAGEDGGG
jgi:hypothetical protein